MKLQKRRIDHLLVERGLVDSRTKAQALIMAGKVFSEDGCVDKPGIRLKTNALLRVSAKDHPWVGRGGLKLAHALEVFRIDPKNCICLDIGASTGGFTDVLLSHGAARVFAVDVGRGQLAWKLQTSDRVIVMDKTNARYLTRGDISDGIDLIVCDASFISLKTILPAPLALANAGTRLVALINPQFEVGRERIGKGGVVSNPQLHKEICQGIKSWLGQLYGWQVLGISESPIKGAEGNKEFFIYAQFLTD